MNTIRTILEIKNLAICCIADGIELRLKGVGKYCEKRCPGQAHKCCEKRCPGQAQHMFGPYGAQMDSRGHLLPRKNLQNRK